MSVQVTEPAVPGEPQRLDPLRSTGVLEAAKVVGQVATDMVRPAFLHHDFQGIALGSEGTVELGGRPFGEERAPLV